ncbi:MAG: hypothetical protein IJM04_08195 [Prevotella sp.]|nr:hypothetical protein [Prevotella sp.]
MNTIDLICIVILCIFAAVCFVTAVVGGVWWHVCEGAMFASLAGTIYYEENNPQ